MKIFNKSTFTLFNNINFYRKINWKNERISNVVARAQESSALKKEGSNASESSS